MSATGRGADRRPADFYPTPSWCVWRLLEAVDLPGGRWLEPCAGDGAIVDAVGAVRRDVDWTAIDVRGACADPLARTGAEVHIGDFLTDAALARTPFDVVITNPPYRHAEAVLRRARGVGHTTILLLRLNFLASAKRATLMRADPPNVYVLPNRPSFTGGGTDSIEYAWFVWSGPPSGEAGRVSVLAPTPLSARRPA